MNYDFNCVVQLCQRESDSGCCNDIENTNTEEIPNVKVLAESAEEKEMHINSYSSSIQFGDAHLFG